MEPECNFSLRWMRNYKTSFIQPTTLEETKTEEEKPTTPLDASQSYAKCQMGVKTGETKLLGVPWNKTEDSIEVNFPGPVINVTKREVLGEIAKIYDPLGLASPVTLVGKMLYREACDARTLWDYELPKELKSMWRELGRSPERKNSGVKKPCQTQRENPKHQPPHFRRCQLLPDQTTQ